jgi:hypothetical protein
MLDGRFMRFMAAPARGPAKLLSAGFGLVTNALNRVLGAQMLTDVQSFIAALDTLFGGFRQRAEATYSLLQADGTAFVVVAAPEIDAMREASYFVERLSEEKMPLVGLVVNRVHLDGVTSITAADAESAGHRLASGNDDERATSELLAVHTERARLSQREARVAQRFTAAHPRVPTLSVSALPGDRRSPSDRCAARRRLGQDAAGWRMVRQVVTFGRRRRSARRSRSVIPPQTPHSIRLSRASARHSARTLQPPQTCLARFCSAPLTNKASDLP